MGRFINADDIDYLGAGCNLTGYNLLAYCGNNPLMFSDPNGHDAEWWQWVISGGMVITGICFVATGFGGPAGGALICSGVNSMIGSYVAESTGGSSVSGWVGGMITGATCGYGAGYSGELLAKATNAIGSTCLGYLAASGVVAFSSGALGSAIGQTVSAAIDGKKIEAKEVVQSAMTTGAINCISGFGASFGNVFVGLPTISTTSITLASSLNVACSLISEAVCDFLGVITSL